MTRIKSQALIKLSKMKKGTSQISVSTILLGSLIIVLIVFPLFCNIRTLDRLRIFQQNYFLNASSRYSTPLLDSALIWHASKQSAKGEKWLTGQVVMQKEASALDGSTANHQLRIKKIENKKNLQVTFSKRKKGVFKKACALSTQCGAELAIIVFSPGNKVFSFGSPNVESVVNHYLTGNSPPVVETSQLVEEQRSLNICNLDSELTQVLNDLEVENKLSDELKRIRITNEAWKKPIQERNVTELEKLMLALEDLKVKVQQQVRNVMFQNSSKLSTTNAGFDKSYE